jgi:hypothetical protein
METYQIRMTIEIVPCTEVPTSQPIKQADGSVQFTLSESDAINIDACERALLQTVYPTLRETLATHFSDVSKKKPVSSCMRGPWSRIGARIG